MAKPKKFAGLSIIHLEDGSQELHFHSSGMSRRKAMQMDVPGRAEFWMLDLRPDHPNGTDRAGAARWLMNQSQFKESYIQDFLQDVIDRAEMLVKQPETPHVKSEKKNKAVAELKKTATPKNKKNSGKKKPVEVTEPELVTAPLEGETTIPEGLTG